MHDVPAPQPYGIHLQASAASHGSSAQVAATSRWRFFVSTSLTCILPTWLPVGYPQGLAQQEGERGINYISYVQHNFL